MKRFLLGAMCPLCLTFAQQIPLPQTAQQPSAAKPVEIAPNTVVVSVMGKNYTAAEVQDMLGGLPPQALTGLQQNPQMGMNQLFLIRLLSDEGMASKLDQQSPHKEALDALKRQYLANAALQERNNKVQVTPAEMEAAYAKNAEKYETAGISVIYVSFSNNPVPSTDPKAKKPLTEAEAKAKAEKLVKELKAGADFAKLAKENSDDKSSAEKGGEFASIRRGDNFPPAIKDAVFKLNAGDVSDPVQQANGFYILKRTAKGAQPYAEVREQIFQQLKQDKFKTEFDALQKQVQVKIEKPEFFNKK